MKRLSNLHGIHWPLAVARWVYCRTWFISMNIKIRIPFNKNIYNLKSNCNWVKWNPITISIRIHFIANESNRMNNTMFNFFIHTFIVCRDCSGFCCCCCRRYVCFFLIYHSVFSIFFVTSVCFILLVCLVILSVYYVCFLSNLLCYTILYTKSGTYGKFAYTKWFAAISITTIATSRLAVVWMPLNGWLLPAVTRISLSTKNGWSMTWIIPFVHSTSGRNTGMFRWFHWIE